MLLIRPSRRHAAAFHAAILLDYCRHGPPAIADADAMLPLAYCHAADAMLPCESLLLHEGRASAIVAAIAAAYFAYAIVFHADIAAVAAAYYFSCFAAAFAALPPCRHYCCCCCHITPLRRYY